MAELTDEFIQELPVTDHDYTVQDDRSPVLVRVRKSGSRCFEHRPRNSGRWKRARPLGSTGSMSIHDARAAAYRFEVAAEDGVDKSLSRQSTVAYAAQEYLVSLELERSESYYRKAEVAFRNRIIPALGDVRISALGIGHIDCYVEAQRTFSAKRNDRGFLSALLSWLVRMGVLQTNFMAGSFCPRRMPTSDSKVSAPGPIEAALKLLNPTEPVPGPARTSLALVALTGFAPSAFLHVDRCRSTTPPKHDFASYRWSVRLPEVQLGPLAHQLSSSSERVPTHLFGRTENGTKRKILRDIANVLGDRGVRANRIALAIESEISRRRLNLSEWEQELRQVLEKTRDPHAEVEL